MLSKDFDMARREGIAEKRRTSRPGETPADDDASSFGVSTASPCSDVKTCHLLKISKLRSPTFLSCRIERYTWRREPEEVRG
jgi:hypothetical protein